MNTDVKEQLCTKLFNRLDHFKKKYDEKMTIHQQQVKACRKKTELETKLAQEMRLNHELSEQLKELSRRSSDIDKVCATLQSRLTIAENDQKRLENAKEMYELMKNLTGIHFDFTAPPNVAKGYIKNERRKLLQTFEIDMGSGDCSEALWSVIQTTIGTEWPTLKGSVK